MSLTSVGSAASDRLMFSSFRIVASTASRSLNPNVVVAGLPEEEGGAGPPRPLAGVVSSQRWIEDPPVDDVADVTCLPTPACRSLPSDVFMIASTAFRSAVDNGSDDEEPPERACCSKWSCIASLPATAPTPTPAAAAAFPAPLEPLFSTPPPGSEGRSIAGGLLVAPLFFAVAANGPLASGSSITTCDSNLFGRQNGNTNLLLYSSNCIACWSSIVALSCCCCCPEADMIPAVWPTLRLSFS